jgi:diguanylate cyclase (GGDEF)-like protein/PAS domain S-box-containing protein
VTLLDGGGGETLVVLRPAFSAAPGGEAGGEGHLFSLLDAMGCAALRLSPDDEIEAANETAGSAAGKEVRTLTGRRFVDLIEPSEAREPVRRALESVRQGRPSGRCRAALGEGGAGRVLEWRFAPLIDAGGMTSCLLAIGEPPRTGVDEAGSEAGDSRLAAVVDHVADGIITIDSTGIVESLNRAAESIFDQARDEITGRHIDQLITHESRSDSEILEALVEACRSGGEAHEMLGRRRSGEVMPIELAINAAEIDGRELFVLSVRDVTLRKQTEETIRSLAYHDPLTGLANRLLFVDRLVQAIERARRNGQPLAVMLVDLDRFKLVNDSMGHDSGDEVLRAVASRMREALRGSDTIARNGSDEFLLLLGNVGSAEGAAKIAQKVIDAIRPTLRIAGHELTVTASIGIAVHPADGEEPETLIQNADTALYRAKEQGPGTYQFYTSDMNATAFQRLVLETHLRRALEQGELAVYYQPQLDLASGDIVGVEALVRWFHPEHGTVPPSEFIPIAEESGLILAIGGWVLETACAQVRRWQKLGFEGLRLAVNMSAHQFRQSDLVETVRTVLKETGLAPSLLELELTEGIVMRNAGATVARLRALETLGVRLAIDDFGTGYSSLGYLKRFPIRALKVDQSFIRDITLDPNDAAIVQAIIAMAESLGIRVAAEGVETASQLELLRRFACHEMQGYLFSRPVPADDLLAILREGRRLES